MKFALIFSPVAVVFALAFSTSAQDTGGSLMDAGEFVDPNYLELANTVLSIYPPLPMEGINAYNEALTRLIEFHESEAKTASGKTDELKQLVDDAKKQEDIVNAKIDVAEKVEDEAEKERLEALKDTHEDRRKYLDRIRKIREQEGKVQEARIAYLKSLRESVDEAARLTEMRSEPDRDMRDLLRVEEELIKLAKKTARLNDKLAGESKKLNDWREDAFKERRKFFTDLETAGGTD